MVKSALQLSGLYRRSLSHFLWRETTGSITFGQDTCSLLFTPQHFVALPGICRNTFILLSYETLYSGQFTLSTQLIMLIYPAILLDSVVRKGITVNLGIKVKLGFNFSCRRACIRARLFCVFSIRLKTNGGKIKKGKFLSQSFEAKLKL